MAIALPRDHTGRETGGSAATVENGKISGLVVGMDIVRHYIFVLNVGMRHVIVVMLTDRPWNHFYGWEKAGSMRACIQMARSTLTSILLSDSRRYNVVSSPFNRPRCTTFMTLLACL